MVGQRPCAVVPFQSVRPGGEVAAIEQHPDQAIGFEFLAERLRWLEELVAVVEPCWLYEASDGEDDSGLPEVFGGYEEPASTALTGGKQHCF